MMKKNKRCPVCNAVKTRAEFYPCPSRSDGLRSTCKECEKANRKKLRSYYREYKRNRYRQDPEFRQRVLATNQKYRDKYPERMVTQDKFYYAIESGLIKKQPCFICGTMKNVQAHHNDYSNPYDVVWVCPKHHRRIHTGDIKLVSAFRGEII